MKRSAQYDLIVVGGGAMGLSTAYHAGREGLRTLVIEQFPLFHGRSSSGGATRQFRIQYAEEYMARLVLRSIPLWDELQGHTRDVLRTRVGSLWFGDPNVDASEGQIKGAMEVLTKVGVPFESLDAAGIERFGFANLPGDYEGLFQPDGGTVNVPATLQTLHDQAAASGYVTFMPQTRVLGMVPREDGVSVHVDGETYEAARVVVAAGPYTNEMLRFLGLELDITTWQMVSCYFRKRDPGVDYPSWFVFEREAEHYDPGLYYGFEEVGWSNPGFIRVCPAFALHTFRDPAEATEQPDPMDLWLTSRWVARHMPGLDPEPRFKTRCLAALPSAGDKKMFLDLAPPSVPGHRNVVVTSAGWAFKLVPLVGKACVDLAVRGETEFDISHFRIPGIQPPAGARLAAAAADMPAMAVAAPRRARSRLPF